MIFQLPLNKILLTVCQLCYRLLSLYSEFVNGKYLQNFFIILKVNLTDKKSKKIKKIRTE